MQSPRVLRLVLVLAVLPACSKTEQSPPPHSGQATYPPTGYGQPQQGPQGYGQQQQSAQGYGQQQGNIQGPPPAPGQMPPLGAVFSDPNMMQSILAGALAGGAATLGALTGGEQPIMQAGIQQQAKTQARGMLPDGQMISGRLQQDGHAEATVVIQPGRCYTVIGFGAPGVFDFQINVMTAPPMPPQILAQSQAGGMTPVVGPNEQCFRNPYPLPLTVKVDLHLLKGTGLVGAQVYKK